MYNNTTGPSRVPVDVDVARVRVVLFVLRSWNYSFLSVLTITPNRAQLSYTLASVVRVILIILPYYYTIVILLLFQFCKLNIFSFKFVAATTYVNVKMFEMSILIWCNEKNHSLTISLPSFIAKLLCDCFELK